MGTGKVQLSNGRRESGISHRMSATLCASKVYNTTSFPICQPPPPLSPYCSAKSRPSFKATNCCCPVTPRPSLGFLPSLKINVQHSLSLSLFQSCVCGFPDQPRPQCCLARTTATCRSRRLLGNFRFFPPVFTLRFYDDFYSQPEMDRLRNGDSTRQVPT